MKVSPTFPSLPQKAILVFSHREKIVLTLTGMSDKAYSHKHDKYIRTEAITYRK